ncbi:DUF883 family protein [Aquabacterium soli]|nr:DUF883 family protein [Aquabacterium soli]
MSKSPQIAAKELDKILVEARTLLNTAGDDAADQASAVTARLKNALHQAQDRLNAFGTDVSDRARKTAKVTDEYVHANPWQAIGVGAAVGIVIGALAARR